MKFTEWLRNQIDREGPIGDLANDLKSDRDFKNKEGNFIEFWNHITFHGACEDALVAAEEARKEYASNLDNRPCEFDLFAVTDANGESHGLFFREEEAMKVAGYVGGYVSNHSLRV